jgi:hypothetical protein
MTKSFLTKPIICSGTIVFATLAISGCELGAYRSSQINISRQEEAKIHISAMNRAQQAHILQRQSFLDFEDMLSQGLNIPPETDYYSYSVVQQDQELAVQQIAQAKQENFKSYTGLTWVILFDDFETGNFQSLQVVCESNEPSTEPVPGFETVSAEASLSEVDCPPGFTTS